VIGIWFFARPHVLSGARVKENCFSLSFIRAHPARAGGGRQQASFAGFLAVLAHRQDRRRPAAAKRPGIALKQRYHPGLAHHAQIATMQRTSSERVVGMTGLALAAPGPSGPPGGAIGHRLAAGRPSSQMRA